MRPGPAVLLVAALVTGCSTTGQPRPEPTGGSPEPSASTSQPAQPGRTLRQRATIRYVYDGDTVQARLASGRVVRVRLLGVDTPEVFGATPDCGGPEATALTRRLLPAGTPVVLVSDPLEDRYDRYGRRLRYVVRGDLDVDRALLRRGAGRVYVYGPTPFSRVASYRAAEDRARQERRGLWGRC